MLLVAIMTILLPVSAQISTCSWHDGYWGKWIQQYSCSILGNYTGFIIYKNYKHPSNYFFQFDIPSYEYIEPTKKIKKEMLKQRKWYEYHGTVEYYVTEQYPTITSVLKTFEFPTFDCDSGSDGNPCVKRTANATIKIAPYKDHPRCYNIYFDDVVVAIDLGSAHF